MRKTFEIAGRSAGFLSPYVIAEIGVNHEGSLERAQQMIAAAAGAGAHAAKFQTYKADLLATPDNSPAYWDRNEEPAANQFALFQRWDSFGPEEYRCLAEHCRQHGIDFLSTPFDADAVELLDPLVPCFKIASADITNLPLLRRVARTGKPVVMSTGAARLDEIAVGLETLSNAGAGPVALLHCVLNYPTPLECAQLAQLELLQQVFGDACAIGYSDHVKPDPDGAMPALEMATLLGAVVIEKHFTDDKAARGNDHYHAMDAADLARFTEWFTIWRTLYGDARRDVSGEATAIANARRRIVARCDLAAGDVLKEAKLIPLRSNVGVEIAHWDRIIGRTLVREVLAGRPLEWADLA